MLQVFDVVRFKDIDLLPYYGYMSVEAIQGDSVKLLGIIGLFPNSNLIKE